MKYKIYLYDKYPKRSIHFVLLMLVIIRKIFDGSISILLFLWKIKKRHEVIENIYHITHESRMSRTVHECLVCHLYELHKWIKRIKRPNNPRLLCVLNRIPILTTYIIRATILILLFSPIHERSTGCFINKRQFSNYKAYLCPYHLELHFL